MKLKEHRHKYTASFRSKAALKALDENVPPVCVRQGVTVYTRLERTSRTAPLFSWPAPLCLLPCRLLSVPDMPACLKVVKINHSG